MHRNSRLIFEKHGKKFFKPGASVLEIGPDGSPSTYQKIVGNGLRWDTLDVLTTYLQPTYLATDQYAYPIPDDSYDIVVSANVIEHVPRIWRWFAELARVCKPGGIVITVNPVSWHFHEAPGVVDCWRMYPAGMKALVEDSGMEMLSSTWESVEFDRLKFLPSRVRAEKRFLMLLFGLFWPFSKVFGVPFEGAFDTITVARKPFSSNGHHRNASLER